MDQFTAPRGLGYYASRLGVRSWPLLCQSGDYFGKDEGCFPSCSRFPRLPTSYPSPPPFSRLYVPSSTCIRAKLSRSISLFSPSLFFFQSEEEEEEEKKKIGKRNRERSSRGYLRRLIRLWYRKENHLSYFTSESSDLCISLSLSLPPESSRRSRDPLKTLTNSNYKREAGDKERSSI